MIDCNNCANRGRVNGLSQETFCDGCVYSGNTWKKDHFKAKNGNASASISAEVDAALDAILVASGSSLDHHKDPNSLEKMRNAMLQIMKKSWVDGSNACHRAMTSK
jgi:hypothetical protein